MYGYVGNARIDRCLIIEKKVNGCDYGIVKPVVGCYKGAAGQKIAMMGFRVV